METEIIIGTVKVKVERMSDEQYVIAPIDTLYFKCDDGTPYEIVIEHNGEEWISGARIFRDDKIDRIVFVTLESEDKPGIYLKMLPEIRRRFGDVALRASRTHSEEESAPDFFDLFASTLMSGVK